MTAVFVGLAAASAVKTAATKGWVTERSIVHAWKACISKGPRGSNPRPSAIWPNEQKKSNRESDRSAGEGNRTLVSSLEGYSSTIELHPRAPVKLTRLAYAAKFFSAAERAGVHLAFSRHGTS